MDHSALTDKQQAFVREYLVDLNASQAAIRAGYSAKNANVTAPRMLANVRIAAAVGIAQAERAKRTEVTADRVLEELAVLGFSNLWDYRIDDDGHVVLADGARPSAIRAVSSIKRKRRVIPQEDGAPIIEVETEIKLWDKPATLRLAGQHLGMYTEKHEHGGIGGGPLSVKVTHHVVDPPKHAG